MKTIQMITTQSIRQTSYYHNFKFYDRQYKEKLNNKLFKN
jgi:hypothetical protein